MPWRETPAERTRARDERPVVVPSPHGDLFGILTPPDPMCARGVCVVAFTRPRSHRNRMFVEMARRLAAEGFAAFRFDYHGTGDSGGASSFLNPGEPYRDDAVAVLRHLREAHGQTRFVLVGSCFDARTALSSFVDEGASIDGIVFIAAPLVELSLLTRSHAETKDWGHVLRALRNPENWRGLRQGERWRHMAMVVSRVARRNRAGSRMPLSPSFVEHFRAFARTKARALFLYGEEDAETPSLRLAERALFARLDPAVRARIEVVVWPGTVHGFLEVPRQRETLEHVTAWIRNLEVARGTDAPGREAAWTSA